MDSILKNKIKIVYDKWVEFNNQKQYLPNGVHPVIFNIIQEKVKITNSLHQAIADTKNVVSGEIFNFDHSNFWGYTTNELESVNVSDVNLDSNVVYVYPLELKGNNFGSKELNFYYNSENVKYYLHQTFSVELLELFKLGKIKILLNAAHDPISTKENFLDIENYFKFIGIDPSNVIFVIGNDYRKQHLRSNPNSKLKISPAPLLLTHQVALNISQYPIHTNLGYMSDIVREEDINKNIRKSKFICLNRTMKPHRYMMAYYALKNNLLKTNYFSFLNSFNSSQERIKEGLTRFNLLEEKELDKFSGLVHNILPHHVDTHSFNESQRSEMTWTNNKKDLYLNSYVNIVTETSFEELDNPFISEKLWKPVMNLQPFIVVGDYRTLRTIRNLGFKTFSPFIDESYDEVLNKAQRMKLIFKELDKLKNMNIVEIHNWYHSILEILIHNKKQLESLKTINPYEVVLDDIVKTYKEKDGI